jgi:hypothetical protein
MSEIDIVYGSIAREMQLAFETGIAAELGRHIAEGFVETVRKARREDPLATAIRALSKDGHQYSTRPCSTCDAITSSLGEPFGCMAMAQHRAKASKP